MLRAAGHGGLTRSQLGSQAAPLGVQSQLVHIGASKFCCGSQLDVLSSQQTCLQRDMRCSAAARSFGVCSTSAVASNKQEGSRTYWNHRYSSQQMVNLPNLTSNPCSQHRLPGTSLVCLCAPSAPSTLAAQSQSPAVEDGHAPGLGSQHDDVLKSLHHHRQQDARHGIRIVSSATSASSSSQSATATAGAAAASAAKAAQSISGFSYPPAQRNQIKATWDTLMRWSKRLHTRKDSKHDPLAKTTKVVVFGGGSFGTAMGAMLAKQKPDLEVVLLLRDPLLCKDINTAHCNTKYLKDYTLPPNVRATTLPAEAIIGAQYAVHAVPVQSSRAFLHGIKDILPANVPIICVSKGLEVGSGQTMYDVIPSALERKQPMVFLSGPSFAKEVMENRPTGVVAASKDMKLATTVQALFASPSMRVNTSKDVVGVEICGALKNVLAIAAGIVEGLDLGHNATAALITQGCSEIRWLAEKLGANPTTVSGLSGLGDIMLTCYGDLSRNRSVGIRLGRGEKIEDIVASSSQVAEGVATAGVVVSLARKYRVSLPVLTAVAQVLDGNLTPRQAVYAIMNLPQVEEV